jgi:hypothetical protein
MSEFQYYEFRALDRPLSRQEQQELRSLSTRAEIDAWSFTNEYHWGNFKGDPHKLMRRYFDAFLYYANWGTHRLAFRLPAAAFDAGAAEPYCDEKVLTLDRHDEHVIVWFDVNEEGGLDWDEIEADLADLLDIRKELLAGDRRPLYLGWLAAQGHRYDDEGNAGEEPPVPPGLKKLTHAQRALADFLWLDDDLLEAAATKSAAHAPKALDAPALRQHLQALPDQEKEAWLERLLLDETPRTRAKLLHKLRPPGPSAATKGRPVADLRAQAEALAEARAKREREEAEKRRLAEEAERERRKQARLDVLAMRGEAAWDEAEQHVLARTEKDYDAAVPLLGDLRDLAVREGGLSECQARIRALRARHERKGNFLKRLDKEGL